MQRKLAIATLGLLLLSSKPSAAVPSGGMKISASAAISGTPMVDGKIGKTGGRKLSSKWEGGTCEIDKGKLVVKTNAEARASQLPKTGAGASGVAPIELSCSQGWVRIAYPGGIDVYGPPASFKDGAIPSTVDFDRLAIGVAFFDGGREAEAAFTDGRTASFDFDDDGTVRKWTSQRPPEATPMTQAAIGRSGPYTYVLFPQTGRVTLSFNDCRGKPTVMEDKLNGGAVSIECGRTKNTKRQEDVCAGLDKDGESVDALLIRCLPEQETPVTKKIR